MANWRVVNSDPRSPNRIAVGCSDISDMPIGAEDELDILLMRQDRLNIVRRVTFEGTPVECKRGQVPAASPEKCLTPRLSTSKHTPMICP